MKTFGLILLLTLAALFAGSACGSSGDDSDDEATNTSASSDDESADESDSSDAAADSPETEAGVSTDTDDADSTDTDDADSTDSSESTASAPTADAAACAEEVPSFASVSASEYVQWDYGEGEKVGQADSGGDFEYFVPDSGILTVYATSAEVDSVLNLTLETDEDPIPARTYRCSEGLGVTLSGVGSATIFGAEAGADCAISFSATVQNGGRVEGTFWALIPEVRIGESVIDTGGCVHGRFALTDKE